MPLSRQSRAIALLAGAALAATPGLAQREPGPAVLLSAGPGRSFAQGGFSETLAGTNLLATVPLSGGRTRLIGALDLGMAASLEDTQLRVACPGGMPIDCPPPSHVQWLVRGGMGLGLERGAVGGRSLRVVAGPGWFRGEAGADGLALNAHAAAGLPLPGPADLVLGASATHLPDFGGARLTLTMLNVGVRLGR